MQEEVIYWYHYHLTYQGIKIQIYEDQDEPRQISRLVKGKFKLLSAGKGKYMDCLLNLIGRIFTSETLREEVNHLEIESGNKATYTYGTEQNIMGILCPSCNKYQTSLDSCQCGYVRMM